MMRGEPLINKDDLWIKLLELSNDMTKTGEARDIYRHCLNIVNTFPETIKYYEAYWIRHGLYFECMNCEGQSAFDTPYCPCCGAKMLGIDEEVEKDE